MKGFAGMVKGVSAESPTVLVVKLKVYLEEPADAAKYTALVGRNVCGGIHENSTADQPQKDADGQMKFGVDGKTRYWVECDTCGVTTKQSIFYEGEHVGPGGTGGTVFVCDRCGDQNFKPVLFKSGELVEVKASEDEESDKAEAAGF